MTAIPSHIKNIISVEIVSDVWLKHFPEAEALKKLTGRVAEAVIGELELREAVELGVRLTDDDEMRILNNSFRGKDESTNVLSFTMGERDVNKPTRGYKKDFPELLGDVVIAYGTCFSEAEREYKPLSNHLQHLIVHGVLHLFGYDHGSKEKAKEMERLEADILAPLGVPDPYDDSMIVRTKKDLC